MEQYIPKSTLVAEIEKRIKYIDKYYCDTNCTHQRIEECRELLLILDSLEVKDVDIRNEVSNWWNNYYKEGDADYKFGKYSGHYMKNSTIISLAKHFFELGLRYNSSYISIPNIDDALKEMGVDPDSNEARNFKGSYYRVLDELKEQSKNI